MRTVHPCPAGRGHPQETQEVRTVFDSLVASFARSKRAVVLVGAGISTNAGIPDFRSPGSGLYARPEEPIASTSRAGSSARPLKGPELFNAAVYREPESAGQHLRFLAGFKRTLDGIVDGCLASGRPASETHGFLRLLKKRDQLLRVYTQNIDGLEGVETGLAAVPLGGTTPVDPRTGDASSVSAISKPSAEGKGRCQLEGDFVQLHGTLWAVRCTTCAFVRRHTEDDDETFMNGTVGPCPACEERASIRTARGQRNLSSLQKAFLRPAVTLYDEPSPGSSALDIGDLAVNDSDPVRGADLMLVMGTSLKIPGFKALVKQFSKTVKARGGICVLVNRDEMTSKSEWKSVFDFEVVMDSDAFVDRILSDWKRLRPQDWTGRQKSLGEMFATTHPVDGACATKAGFKSAPKKREPLTPLSLNAISARSAQADRARQLPPTPPSSSRKRQRAQMLVAEDDSDRSGIVVVIPPPKRTAWSTPTKTRMPRTPVLPPTPTSLTKTKTKAATPLRTGARSSPRGAAESSEVPLPSPPASAPGPKVQSSQPAPLRRSPRHSREVTPTPMAVAPPLLISPEL